MHGGMERINVQSINLIVCRECGMRGGTSRYSNESVVSTASGSGGRALLARAWGPLPCRVPGPLGPRSASAHYRARCVEGPQSLIGIVGENPGGVAHSSVIGPDFGPTSRLTASSSAAAGTNPTASVTFNSTMDELELLVADAASTSGADGKSSERKPFPSFADENPGTAFGCCSHERTR